MSRVRALLRRVPLCHRAARAWERIERRRQELLQQAIVVRARLYRRRLSHATFIGVTGSCGKTTTKEFIAAVLCTRLKGRKSPDTYNRPHHLARTMLQLDSRDDFCVVEIGGPHPGRVAFQVGLVKPQIGVVTAVSMDHISTYRTVEAIAAEKSKLVALLPASGTAVLNADDPRVLTMREQARCRVMTYGMAPSATVRAEDVSGRWPDRLAFTVVYAGLSHRIETTLCGKWLLPNVLAALAVGIAMEIPLPAAAEAVRTVLPYPGRMSPVTSPDEITFIRDDYKAPLYSIPSTLGFLNEARARRKTVVIGTISDVLGPNGPKYVSVAKQALEVADHVIFVGQNASMCLKAKRHAKGKALYAASTVEDARRHLARVLRAGDLVLLKGSKSDHLESLVDTRPASTEPEVGSQQHRPGPPRNTWPIQVIVGLGNPGEKSKNTPHNVGEQTMERLAKSLAVHFESQDGARVARVEQPAATWYLVQPTIPINHTGSVLVRLAEQLGFGAQDCIIVQDDIDLPVGVVRIRMDGSDGGHRGVRSVLLALQSDAVRRVKIGVGRPTQRTDVRRHVLGTFGADDAAAMSKACEEAAERVFQLLGVRGRLSGVAPLDRRSPSD